MAKCPKCGCEKIRPVKLDTPEWRPGLERCSGCKYERKKGKC